MISKRYQQLFTILGTFFLLLFASGMLLCVAASAFNVMRLVRVGAIVVLVSALLFASSFVIAEYIKFKLEINEFKKKRN